SAVVKSESTVYTFALVTIISTGSLCLQAVANTNPKKHKNDIFFMESGLFGEHKDKKWGAKIKILRQASQTGMFGIISPSLYTSIHIFRYFGIEAEKLSTKWMLKSESLSV